MLVSQFIKEISFTLYSRSSNVGRESLVLRRSAEILNYGKDKANERTCHLIISDHYRQLLHATPKELQVQTWKEEILALARRSLKVPKSYRPGTCITAEGRQFS